MGIANLLWIGDWMYNELTEYEQSVIDEFKHYEKEAHVAMRKVEAFRRTMLSTLGRKADCHLCGNHHWPVCNAKEVDYDS